MMFLTSELDTVGCLPSHLRCLVLCSSLARPQDAQIIGNMLLRGFCFGRRWTFKSVDWVSRLPSIMWVGLIQSVEGMNGMKRLILILRILSKREFSCLIAFRLKHWLLSCLWTWPEKSVLSCLKPACLQTGTTPLVLLILRL